MRRVFNLICDAYIWGMKNKTYLLIAHCIFHKVKVRSSCFLEEAELQAGGIFTEGIQSPPLRYPFRLQMNYSRFILLQFYLPATDVLRCPQW